MRPLGPVAVVRVGKEGTLSVKVDFWRGATSTDNLICLSVRTLSLRYDILLAERHCFLELILGEIVGYLYQPLSCFHIHILRQLLVVKLFIDN